MAVHLATVADYLQRTTSLLNPAADQTVCLWVKFDAVAVSPLYQTPYIQLDNPAVYTDWLAFFGETVDLRLDGTPINIPASPPTVSTWYHLAYTQTGTTLRFYVNGALIGSATYDRSAVTVGYELAGNDTFSTGNLDLAYIRTWQTALTQAQIQAEMSSSTAVHATNLWMDTPLTSDLSDISGNGRNWTGVGAHTFVNGPFPAVYYDVTATPFSQLVTQAVFNGGTHGFSANQVYFRYVAATQTALGGVTNSGGTFTPKTFIFPFNGGTELHHITGAFGYWYLLDAGTYWIEVTRNGGGASNFDFTTQFNIATLNPALPAGAIVINDDTEGFKGTAWKTDGTFLGVMTQIPASETGDALSNGAQLWTDRFGALGAVNSLARFSTAGSYLSNVSPTPAISSSRFPIVAHSDTTFYVLNSGTGALASITQGGTVTNTVATLPLAAYSALGINPAGTIAYWAEGFDSPAIHRHDLVNDAPLSDLYTVPALSGGHTGSIALTAVNLNPGEILVLSDNSVVTWYHDVTANEDRIIQISAAGTLLTSKTYTGNYSLVDHLHYSPDNPTAIHAWFFKTSAAQAGRIGKLTLSTGVLSPSFDTNLFSAGINFLGSEMFGPSASCTMLTLVYLGGGGTTGAIQVVKVTEPSGASTDFGFVGTGTGVDPTFDLHDGELITFSSLTPGTGYSVTETVPAGWSVSYDVSNGSSRTAILVVAGEVTVVTVTNTASGGTSHNEYFIRRERWFPHLSQEQFRQFFAMLQIDLQAGNGLGNVPSTTQGSNPLLEIDWSDDGGWTWSSIRFVETGKVGAYTQRAIIRRLGYSRDRVFRIACSDPNQWVIVNGYVQVVLGTS